MKKPLITLMFIAIIAMLWWLTDTGRMLLLEMSFSDTQEVVVEGEFIGYEKIWPYKRSKSYWSALIITETGIETVDMRGMIGYNSITSDLDFNIGDHIRFKTLSFENNLVAVDVLEHDSGDFKLSE